MTKQQHSATALSPSRLCRLLLVALSLKLFVLGFLLFDPVMPKDDGKAGFMAFVAGVFTGSGGTAAEAATGEGAGAPPAIDATLPDAGMDNRGPGTPGSLGAPGAAPGIASPAGNASLPMLPPLGNRPVPGAVNGTGETPPPSLERDNLARRQEDLARKEQELRVLEGELSKKLEQMQMLENRIAMMMKDAEGAQDAKFRHLVDVLSNMKAKQAATVLETLDPKIAVKVLAGMRGRQAGEILTFVKPEKAAQLTESLARMQLPLD